jgi:hypothetical protein
MAASVHPCSAEMDFDGERRSRRENGYGDHAS